MAEQDTRTVLGIISGPHGIKGEVKITSFTADPSDITSYGPLQDKTGSRTFEIEKARVHKSNVLIARLIDVRDRNDAEALRGVELYVERSLLPDTDDEEFYYSDLIGLAAVDETGAPFGRITAVQNFGAGDLLEIELEGQKKTVLLPFTKEVVPELDIDGGRLTVLPPEGFFDPDKQDDGRNDPKDD